MEVWPNGKRIAVAISVMFEAYSEGKGPSYSVQTTPLKPGIVNRAAISWGEYGGRLGVWRLTRTLNRFGIPATFFTSARATELYPEATAFVVASGHDLAGHGYAQDQLLAEQPPDEERATIRRCRELLERAGGKPPQGWLSPVLAWSADTTAFLAAEGFTWHADVNDADFPRLVEAGGRPIVAIPHADFMDNRTLRTNAHDYYDVYAGTMDYLHANEPGSLLVIGIHCQYGGRPMMCAVFERVLRYVLSFPDAGVVSHAQLAGWFRSGDVPAATYAQRYLGG